MRYPKKKFTYDSFNTDFVGGTHYPDAPVSYGELRGLKRILSFVLYRLMATPVAWLHSTFVLRQRIIGREKLRHSGGVLIVGNHTELCGDAFTPSLVAFPRRTNIVVHRDNVTHPFLRHITPLLGALPTPNTLREGRELSLRVADLLSLGCAVAVYPEAHLWCKCSFLRPFDPTAFDPAVRGGYPVFSATRVYRSHKLFGYVTRLYIDGPFYHDGSLPRSQAARELCDRVHAAMSDRLREGDICIIGYLPVTAEKSNQESKK